MFATFVLGVALLLGVGIYLETSFDKVVLPDRQTALFELLDEQPGLPSSFTDVIDKYYPGYLTKGVWSAWFAMFFGNYSKACPCQHINLRGWTLPVGHVRKVTITALEMEEHYSPKRCYEIMMAQIDYQNGFKGVSQAAKGYYNKELYQLSEQEILELDITRRATTFYNSLSNRGNLDEAVGKVLRNRKYLEQKAKED